MQPALWGRALDASYPLDEDIRLAAVTGYPWLVVDRAKMQQYLKQPEYNIRDLKRLFLRTQPAAIDGLHLPDSDPAHAPMVDAQCKEARRLGAPVLILRVDRPDRRIVELAGVAQRWSTVLALAPSPAEGPAFTEVRALVREAEHEALGWLIDTIALWQGGESLQPSDAARTVLVMVGDQLEDGTPVLPGEGVLPLPALLAPLVEGGYDGIAALTTLPMASGELEPLARAGRTALVNVLRESGWAVQA